MVRIRSVKALLALALASAAGGQAPDAAALARDAGAAMKRREFATAERLYLQLSEMYPDEPGLALNVGLARYSSGKYAQAIPPLRKFLESQPGHGPAWLLVGISHQKLGRPGRGSPAPAACCGACPRE